LADFFKKLTKAGRMCGYFMQDNPTAYTVNFSVAVVQGVFGKLLVTSVDCGPSIS
jgi:hypothetical protein